MEEQSHGLSFTVSQVSESMCPISDAQVYAQKGCVTLWWLLGTDEQYPKPKEQPREQVGKRHAFPGHK